MTVDRWDLERVDYEDYCMVLCSSGDYVMFEEYEALENDYNILRRDYQDIMDKLKDIWVEG